MGDVLIVILPALILAAVLWALTTALKPRNFGISDAERYQQDLALRSQAHYAAQVQAANCRPRPARSDHAPQPERTAAVAAGGSRPRRPAGALRGRRPATRMRVCPRPPEPAARPAAPVAGPRRPQDPGHQAAAAGHPLRPFDRQELRRSAVAHGIPADPRSDPGARGRRRAAGGPRMEPPRRAPRPAPAPQPDPTPRAGPQAAAKLNEEQHRRLYALIAQGQAMAAIKLYYEATGEGLRASRDAVRPWRPTPSRSAPRSRQAAAAGRRRRAAAFPVPLPRDRQQGRRHAGGQQQHAQR